MRNVDHNYVTWALLAAQQNGQAVFMRHANGRCVRMMRLTTLRALVEARRKEKTP